MNTNLKQQNYCWSIYIKLFQAMISCCERTLGASASHILNSARKSVDQIQSAVIRVTTYYVVHFLGEISSWPKYNSS